MSALPDAVRTAHAPVEVASGAAAKNPHFFIVGCPRSGTTMLKRMVKAHPEIAITRETHWIPGPFEKQKGVAPDGTVTLRVVDELLSHYRFSQMKVGRPQLEAWIAEDSGISYAQFVSRIFTSFAERKGKPLVGDKTPPYVRKVRTLAKLWPAARIVHLVRDGRDVWLSMKNWRMAHKAAGRFDTWNRDPLVTTALWWRALVLLGHQDGLRLDADHYHAMRYEHLVADPASQCANLAGFLGVDYVDLMVRYHEGKVQTGRQLSANAAWLPPTTGLRDWRTQMSSNELERFEAAAGDALAIFGYERSCDTPSGSVLSDVLQLKDQFSRHANTRDWQLPVPW